MTTYKTDARKRAAAAGQRARAASEDDHADWVETQLERSRKYRVMIGKLGYSAKAVAVADATGYASEPAFSVCRGR